MNDVTKQDITNFLAGIVTGSTLLGMLWFLTSMPHPYKKASEAHCLIDSGHKRYLLTLSAGEIEILDVTDKIVSIGNDSISFRGHQPGLPLKTFAQEMPEAKMQVEKFLEMYGKDIKSGTLREWKKAFGIEATADPQSFAIPRRRDISALLFGARQNGRA